MRSDTRFWGVAALFGALILLVTGIVLEPDSIGAPAGAAYIAAAVVALLGVVGIWMGRKRKPSQMTTVSDRWHTNHSISHEIARLLGRQYVSFTPFDGAFRNMRVERFGWTTLDQLCISQVPGELIVPGDTLVSSRRPNGPAVLLVFVRASVDHAFVLGDGHPPLQSEGRGTAVFAHYVRYVAPLD